MIKQQMGWTSRGREGNGRENDKEEIKVKKT